MEKTGGMTISYDLQQLAKIPKLLREIERAGGRADPPLKKWGVYMLQQTEKTFRNQGRRGTAKQWPALSAATLAIRAGRKRGRTRANPRNILQNTGHLKRSIRTTTYQRPSGKAQFVFTQTPYSRIHQEGGYTNLPTRSKTKKGKRVKVPKRQFLFISKRDQIKALKLVRDHAKNTAVTASRAVR